MRHGDSPNSKLGDAFRRLSSKGENQAKEAGLYLKKTRNIPDCVFYSPSERTEKTKNYVVKTMDGTIPEKAKKELYLATSQTILDTIESCPDEIQKLLIIAHNPGLSNLARSLHLQKSENTQFLNHFTFSEGSVLILNYPVSNWSLASITKGEFVDYFKSS